MPSESPTDPLTAMLLRYPFAVLDGALATELERRGADLDDPLWSARVLVEQPGRITDVHRAYLEAGADIISTATYQATVPGLIARGLTPTQAREYLRLGNTIARQARQAYWDSHPDQHPRRPTPLIAASLGSYGAYLADGSEYTGNYGLPIDALVAFHQPRLDLLTTGADIVAFETIPSRVEAEAIARVLEPRPELAAWVSFSCRDDQRVCDGQPLTECIATLASLPAVVALGVNCVSPASVTALVECIARSTPKPIVVYPNSGERWSTTQACWHGRELALDRWVELTADWVSAGARVVGGCCRTGPAHVGAIARWRDGLTAT